MSKCERCVSDKSWCVKCIDNPIYQTILQALPQKSCFMSYKPVCPRGYVDCVGDPAYIKYHYELYKNENRTTEYDPLAICCYVRLKIEKYL